LLFSRDVVTKRALGFIINLMISNPTMAIGGICHQSDVRSPSTGESTHLNWPKREISAGVAIYGEGVSAISFRIFHEEEEERRIERIRESLSHINITRRSVAFVFTVGGSNPCHHEILSRILPSIPCICLHGHIIYYHEFIINCEDSKHVSNVIVLTFKN